MKNSRLVVVILPVVVLTVFIAAVVTAFCFMAFGNGYVGPEPTEASETVSVTEEPTPEESESESEEKSESEEESEEESGSEETGTAEALPVPQARRIWVGDSRVVGLSTSSVANPGEDAFIGKNGRYYVWFSNDALPVLRRYLSDGKAYEVIIMIGINDCANYEMGLLPYFGRHYATLINSLIDQYPNARFWFLSVAGVVGTYGENTQWEVKMDNLNRHVGPFNKEMKEQCRAAYLPVGELIKAENKTYIDGVHFTTETNRWLYDYVLQCISGSGENPGDKEYSDVWNNTYVPETVDKPSDSSETPSGSETDVSEPESSFEPESGSSEEEPSGERTESSAASDPVPTDGSSEAGPSGEESSEASDPSPDPLSAESSEIAGTDSEGTP